MSALTAFLASPERPAGTLGYRELRGFIFAIASAPEMISPGEWLPLVFDDEDPAYSSVKEAEATLERIMALYNEVKAAVLEGSGTLAADCEFRDDVMSNLDDDAPVAQWSRGFSVGHQWLEEAIVGYAHLGRSIHDARTATVAEERGRPARSTKIGRNAPCPYGSGKKYKRCCGANLP